jgi:large subunit ribosomal protein L23
MREAQKIIRRPLVTEKSTQQKEAGRQYVFEVDPDANKIEIQHAVEQLFKVKVEQVRTCNVLGKLKRLGRRYGKRPDWKKATVTLKEGDRIEFFEGA